MTRPPGPPPPPPPPERCPHCRSAWAGNPPTIYHDPACPRAGVAAKAATPGRVRPPARRVQISTTDIDGHVNCAHCDYSTAGSEIKDAAIGHTQQTGHTTVINLRAIQRIQPA